MSAEARLQASIDIVRLTPPRPPTPFRVNPKPSWIGGKSKVMMRRSENPDEPSGMIVSITPMTFDLHDRIEDRNVEHAGVLTFGSGRRRYSRRPRATPASISRPRPLGGLKPIERSAGPRLPPLPGNSRRPVTPTDRPTPGSAQA